MVFDGRHPATMTVTVDGLIRYSMNLRDLSHFPGGREGVTIRRRPHTSNRFSASIRRMGQFPRYFYGV
jgi:hypothetical protein